MRDHATADQFDGAPRSGSWRAAGRNLRDGSRDRHFNLPDQSGRGATGAVRFGPGTMYCESSAMATIAALRQFARRTEMLQQAQTEFHGRLAMAVAAYMALLQMRMIRNNMLSPTLNRRPSGE